MKTGFREHLFASLLAALAFFLVFPNFELLPASLSLFVLSSLLPDIDHPKSIPRKIVRTIFFTLAFFSVLFFALLYLKTDQAFIVVIPLIALLPAFLLTHLFEASIPKHRREMHSPLTGFLFGLLVFLTCSLSLSFYVSLAFGASVAGGYIFHILVDFVGDRI